MRRLVFINRFFAPDRSATNQILSDLAFDLAGAGRQPHVVTSRQIYDDAKAALSEREILNVVDVHRVASTPVGRGHPAHIIAVIGSNFYGYIAGGRSVAATEGHQKTVATRSCLGQNQKNRVSSFGVTRHWNVRDNGAKTMANNPAAERGLKLLEKCTLFGALDAMARRELAEHAHPRHFAAGDAICRIDEHGDSMMAVVLGVVRISLPAARGKEIILADLRAGEVFGEIALLDGKPRSANATALTNCELIVLERRDVLPFLERNPAACMKLMELLCARVRRSDERMSDIAFFDLPARLAKTLLSYPAQAHGAAKLSLSQRELAEMSGGTRENVNRCLRDWQRRGILELKDRWTIILKPEALRELVTEP